MAKHLSYLFFIFCFCSCTIGFRGVSISPDVNTYSVAKVKISHPNAPLEISQQFSEALKQKIQEESRLNLVSRNADIDFKADITFFGYNAVAPEEGNTTTFNRLEIKVKVVYENEVDEKDGWTKSYSDFEDFPGSQSILDVQDDLTETILEDIIDRIFNDAFTNW